MTAICDDDATATTSAERAFLRAIGGSCKTPVGATTRLAGDMLFLRGMIADPDGNQINFGQPV